MTPIRPSSIGDGIAIIPETSSPQTSPSGEVGGFADALTRAIGSVDQLQTAADQQATALADGGGNLHETSIALAKAEVGFHLMTKIRDRVVDAYQDIMKMSM